MTTITMRHIRKAGMCSRGLRAFAEEHNLDWDDFLKNGMSTDRARLIDDAMVQRVVALAEAEEANDGQG